MHLPLLFFAISSIFKSIPSHLLVLMSEKINTSSTYPNLYSHATCDIVSDLSYKKILLPRG